jgi:hypothetical protein
MRRGSKGRVKGENKIRGRVRRLGFQTLVEILGCYKVVGGYKYPQPPPFKSSKPSNLHIQY